MAETQKKRPRAAPTAEGMDKPEVPGMSKRKSRARAPERGRRIAQARRRAGLTQPQLAEQVGVSRATVARVEAGDVSPRVALALRIGRALGESVEALFGRDD